MWRDKRRDMDLKGKRARRKEGGKIELACLMLLDVKPHQ